MDGFKLVSLDASRYEWDEDGFYVQTYGKRHRLGDDRVIKITPIRMDGPLFNLGILVEISNNGKTRRILLDSLEAQILVNSINTVFVEQSAARMAKQDEAIDDYCKKNLENMIQKSDELDWSD